VGGGGEGVGGLGGLGSPLLATAAFYLLAVVVLPLLAVGGAAAISRRWGRPGVGTLEVATPFAYALVPLGFGMWLAHYTFHFVTGFDTALPGTPRFAAGLGATPLRGPEWVRASCRELPAWLLPLEILFLDMGLLLSLYAGYRLAPTLRALAPWALLMVLLFAVGVWILFQPMQMRGTF